MNRQTVAASVALVSGLTIGRSAMADTIWLEAESCRDPFRGTITSPLLIKDDATASGASYIQVASGNNSQASMPASEGVATYRFSVMTGGVHKIWGRVMAPTVNDDSFWVRMDKIVPDPDGGPDTVVKGSAIRWNDITPGTAWHWTRVVADGTTTPFSFNLTAGDYVLNVAYREDGARLDVMVITSDTAFNPTSPPAGAPAAPQVVTTAAGRTAARINWSEVPGAKTYTVRYTPIAPAMLGTLLKSGITGHTFTDTEIAQNCYQVFAVSSSGVVGPASDGGAGSCRGTDELDVDIRSDLLSLTAPMRIVDDSDVSVVPGNVSLNAPPAHGRARFDFQAAQQTKVHVFAPMSVVDKDHDSWWVRMDDGVWIKWNDIKTGCQTVTDDNNSDKIVVFDIAPGSHRFEWAYREDQTTITSGRIRVLDTLHDETDPCSD
jgi:hypothetical protein